MSEFAPSVVLTPEQIFGQKPSVDLQAVLRANHSSLMPEPPVDAAIAEMSAYSGIPEVDEAAGLDPIRTGVELPTGRIATGLAISTGVFGTGVATAAAAEVQPANKPAITITQLDTNVNVRVGKSSMSDADFAKATIMTNHRTISKARMKRAEKEGDCKTFDGHDTTIYTEGHYEGGNAAGRDTRTSRFCKVNGQWYRELCGNKAWIHEKPEGAIENVIWANGKAWIKVSATANAKADAACAADYVSASASGSGSASASAKMRVSSSFKAHGKAQEMVMSVHQQVEGGAKAQAGANATAQVVCESAPAPVQTVTTTEVVPVPVPYPVPTPPEQQPNKPADPTPGTGDPAQDCNDPFNPTCHG
jgi:hypothetical protein